MNANNLNRIDLNDLLVKRAAHPDWPTGAERVPEVGEEVYCVEGVAQVVKILGRTGDGSRLLELKLVQDAKAKPFFAAASNVLVQPRQAA